MSSSRHNNGKADGMNCDITRYPDRASRGYYVAYGETFEALKFNDRYHFAFITADEMDEIEYLVEHLEPGEYLEISP